MNDKTSRRTADDGAIRRLVTELVDDAPTTSAWSQVEQRADQPNRVTPIMDQRPGTSRPGLMLVAAAAVVALVGVAAAVATRGSGPDDRLVPADSEVASTPPEATVATTEAPLFEPVVTAETVPVEPSPVSIEPGAIEQSDPEVDDWLVGDATTDDVIVPVDYPEMSLAQATNLPMDAWVVAGTLPDGIFPRYATGSVGRTVAYGDADGRSIQVSTDPQPVGGPEAIDVNGVIWNISTFDDTAMYYREVGLVTVIVETVGIDRDAAIPVLDELRVGGDQILPVDVIQPIDVVRRDNDLVAIDEGAFRTPATFRARGVNGWFCTEIAHSSAAGLGCGYGRNGQLSTKTVADTTGRPGESGGELMVLSGIVAPEVAEVEVVFADGTSDRAAAVDLSGTHDDKFWILEVEITIGDPFVNLFDGIEILLVGADGATLGTAPIGY